MSQRILAITWNAGGLRICESLDPTTNDANRKGFTGLFKKKCVVADFLNSGLNDIITSNKPEVCIFSTQGEDSSYSYLHGKALVSFMNAHSYSLLATNELNGVGEAESGLNLTPITGTPTGGCIKTSIYVHISVIAEYHASQVEAMARQLYPSKTNASGAIATYFRSPRGKFVYININFPVGSERLELHKGRSFPRYRGAFKAKMVILIDAILARFVDSVTESLRPDHIMLGGDFGCLLDIAGKNGEEIVEMVIANKASISTMYNQYDEMKSVLSANTYFDLQEGINGQGPTFLPTWSMNRERGDSCKINPQEDCYSVAKGDTHSTTGWPDRILHRGIVCEHYDSVDLGNITKSNHSAVMAIYKF